MESSAAPPLCMENVSKRFRQGNATIEALRNVSLVVERGQFLAVMGASGSGKSTLLHVMSGLTRPEQGAVVVEGEDLSSMADHQRTLFRRRRIGLVFQAFNLIPTLTARDNILLPALADGGMPFMDVRLDELLGKLGLDQRQRHLPHALSGGEQQRVAIARAMIRDPAIVLADEPTGSLDSVTGQGLCRLLKQLANEHRRTVVVVTHEPAVAVWADRIVVLKDGQMLSDFSTADFRNAHSLAIHYHEVVGAAPVMEVTR